MKKKIKEYYLSNKLNLLSIHNKTMNQFKFQIKLNLIETNSTGINKSLIKLAHLEQKMKWRINWVTWITKKKIFFHSIQNPLKINITRQINKILAKNSGEKKFNCIKKNSDNKKVKTQQVYLIQLILKDINIKPQTHLAGEYLVKINFLKKEHKWHLDEQKYLTKII